MTLLCGTYSGWSTHSKAKEAPCEPCKVARREYLAKWREANRDRLKEKHAKWREENKKHVTAARKENYEDNKEHYAQLHKKWKAANPEKVQGYKDKWLANNPEKRKEAEKKWRLAHPENGKMKEGRRRARIRETKVEDFTEQHVLDLYGISCHICNLEIDMDAPRRTNQEGWENGLHLDHLIPLAKGGTHTIDNLRPAHGLCNTRKSHKVLQYATAVPDTWEQDNP